ncbi:unnamed protein product [Cuscuta campestris]|uniref:Uncharacterized protein n=1 Tax=Cuscuta campestris TaxID=132261 RepID=A0A484MDI3_9ASTE|nr:unnamed protein product [Cuscuta campestris]
MDVTASTSRKRHREPESGVSDQSLPAEDNLEFTDTFVAIRMMCAQFPHIEKVSIRPFVLQSQLYSSVKDRTQVDRELEVRYLLPSWLLKCIREVMQAPSFACLAKHALYPSYSIY